MYVSLGWDINHEWNNTVTLLGPHVWWCNRPPVREVCLNYEVVIFQPRTVTPPHLGSVAYRYTFKLGLPPHLFLPPFSGSLFSLLRPAPSLYVAVHRWIPPIFHPLHTSSYGLKRHPPGRLRHPPPASLRRFSLQPAPRACVCHRLPWRCDRPFSTIGLHPCPCQPLVGLPVAVHSAPLYPCLAILEFSSESWHH